LLTIVTFIVLSPLQESASSRANSENTHVVDVSYCDLVNNPERYDQKIVRVSAVYVYGFEGAVLYCPECYRNEYKTWVKPEESLMSCTRPGIIKKLKGDAHKGRTLSVIMVGKFHGKEGRFGHENSYRFQLDLSCVEAATVLAEGARAPGDIPEKSLRLINC